MLQTLDGPIRNPRFELQTKILSLRGKVDTQSEDGVFTDKSNFKEPYPL